MRTNRWACPQRAAKLLQRHAAARVIWEDKLRTTQKPQGRTATQRAPCRYYAIPLQLGYKATSKLGPLYGFGQIRVISSKDIIFGPGDGLQTGMNAEIVIAWPSLLDGRIRLQLVIDAIITSRKDGVAEARILAYDFRTRGPAKAGAGTKRSAVVSHMP